MSGERDQIVTYIRRLAQRERGALEPKPPGVRASLEYDHTAAALASFFALTNCANAIARGEHLKEGDNEAV